MASKAAKPLFISWCPKDALDGMQALNPWEELAYRRTLDLLYLHDGKLPDDDERMGWLTKVGVRRWKKIKPALIAMQKLTAEDGFLTQQRATRVLAETHLYIEGQSSKAKTKWAKEKDKKINGGSDAAADAGAPSRHVPRHMPEHMPNGCHGNAAADANLNPITSSTTSSSVPTTAREPSAEEGDVALIATEIWRLAGRETEGDKWHVNGKIDDYRHVRGWLDRGFTHAEITAAAKSVIDGAGEIRSLWGLLAKAMPEALEAQRAPAAPTTISSGTNTELWVMRIDGLVTKGVWISSFGPKPFEPGCQVPAVVLAMRKAQLVQWLQANPEAA
jgi:hypothetical protein